MPAESGQEVARSGRTGIELSGAHLELSTGPCVRQSDGNQIMRVHIGLNAADRKTGDADISFDQATQGIEARNAHLEFECSTGTPSCFEKRGLNRAALGKPDLVEIERLDIADRLARGEGMAAMHKKRQRIPTKLPGWKPLQIY